MDKGYVEETVCRVKCGSCPAIFYRETVYKTLSYRVKCPRCGSTNLKIIVQDVTKLLEW